MPGFPPSINSLYATYRGRRIKSREGRKWEVLCKGYTRNAALKAWGTTDISVLKGYPLYMEFWLYRPSWRSQKGLLVRPDLMNHEKALTDGIMAAIGLDDSSIISFRASKVELESEPSVRALLKFI